MYSEETLKNAGDFAELLLTNQQLAQVLAIPLAQLRVALLTDTCPLGHAVRTARLKTTAALNRAQIDLAIRGSATAQSAVEDLIRKVNT